MVHVGEKVFVVVFWQLPDDNALNPDPQTLKPTSPKGPSTGYLYICPKPILELLSPKTQVPNY